MLTIHLFGQNQLNAFKLDRTLHSNKNGSYNISKQILNRFFHALFYNGSWVCFGLLGPQLTITHYLTSKPFFYQVDLTSAFHGQQVT